MNKEKKPFSVIDLGSNSVRLSIYDNVVRMPQILYEEGHLTELGKDLNAQGCLSPEGLETVFKSFQRFHKIAQDYKTTPTILATEAIRQAKDGPATLEKLQKTFNFPAQLLSGKEEMDLAYQTILFCKENASGLVADYGGGSLELAWLENGTLKKGTSLPIGALRLLQNQDGRDFSYEETKIKVEEALLSLPWINDLKEHPFTLFLLGGSWRALAQFYMQKIRYPLPLVHGYTPDPKSFSTFIEEVTSYTEKDLKELSFKRPKKTLIRASLALCTLLKILKPSSLFYCGYGIREGFLFSLLSSQEKQSSSFTYFAQNHREQTNFSYALFKKITPLFPFMEEAFLESLISLSTPFYPRQYPFQGEQAFFDTLTWNISSWTHEERIFCALVRYISRQGHAPFAHKSLFLPLKTLEKRLFKRALALGQILHILNDLSGQSSTLLEEIDIYSKEKMLILQIPYDYPIKEVLCSLFEEAAQNMGFSSCILRKTP